MRSRRRSSRFARPGWLAGNATIDRAELDSYRRSASEAARIESLLSLLPASAGSLLEIGARDGYVTERLRRRYARVVAIDLVPVRGLEAGCLPVVADLARLPFAGDAFEAVLCAEVLEHIRPDLLPEACRELARVTRRHLVVGVPFEQDLRIGRTTCLECGFRNPPWSHHNSFTRERLEQLLSPLEIEATAFVERRRAATNRLAVWILDRIGNPWGSYEQDEPCAACGRKLRAPELSTAARLAGRFANALNWLATRAAPERPAWLHLSFRKG